MCSDSDRIASRCDRVLGSGPARSQVAVSSRVDGIVRILNVESGSAKPVRELRNLHEKPPHVLKFHEPLHLVSAELDRIVTYTVVNTLQTFADHT